jgi:hypothetical protein
MKHKDASQDWTRKVQESMWIIFSVIYSPKKQPYESTVLSVYTSLLPSWIVESSSRFWRNLVEVIVIKDHCDDTSFKFPFVNNNKKLMMWDKHQRHFRTFTLSSVTQIYFWKNKQIWDQSVMKYDTMYCSRDTNVSVELPSYISNFIFVFTVNGIWGHRNFWNIGRITYLPI